MICKSKSAFLNTSNTRWYISCTKSILFRYTQNTAHQILTRSQPKWNAFCLAFKRFNFLINLNTVCKQKSKNNYFVYIHFIINWKINKINKEYPEQFKPIKKLHKQSRFRLNWILDCAKEEFYLFIQKFLSINFTKLPSKAEPNKKKQEGLILEK